MHVMVVDDNETIAALVGLIIEEFCAMEVVGPFADTEDARAHAHWDDVDVVLTDYAVPRPEDGERFVDWIHTHHPDVSVVVMTATLPTSARVDDLRRDLAVTDLLLKPFSHNTLCTLMRNIEQARR